MRTLDSVENDRVKLNIRGHFLKLTNYSTRLEKLKSIRRKVLISNVLFCSIYIRKERTTYSPKRTTFVKTKKKKICKSNWKPKTVSKKKK